MKSRVLFVVVFATLVCFETARATNEPSFSGEASVSVLNEYVGLSGLVCEPDTVVQPSLTLSHASGFYVNVWDSTGVKGYEGDEIDFYLGWAGETFGFNTDLSVGYYDIHRFFSGRAGDFWTAIGRVGKTFDTDVVSVEPFIRIEGVIAEDGTDCGGGMLYTGGVKLEKLLTPFLLWAEPKVTYTPGIYDSDEAFIFQTDLGIDWNCWRELTLTPTASVLIPSSYVDREKEIVFGGKASYTF